LLSHTGRLGCIREGAAADLLVADGNPPSDISVLAQADMPVPVCRAVGRFL
jgi:imidazolonepropionase-like amidohydrolase